MIPRIISIRQPWAWAITVPPAGRRKDLENRDWSTNYRGPILIHASKRAEKITPELRRFLESETDLEVPDDFPRGGIVGKANVVDVVSKSKPLWFQGKFAFVLKDAAAMPLIPCNGQLGIYYRDAALLKLLQRKGLA